MKIFMIISTAVGLLTACGQPVHDVNGDWYTTYVNATAKDFAWAAVGCGVPKGHWEVNEKLEIQRFSTLCMRHYGYYRSRDRRGPNNDSNPPVN